MVALANIERFGGLLDLLGQGSFEAFGGFGGLGRVRVRGLGRVRVEGLGGFENFTGVCGAIYGS